MINLLEYRELSSVGKHICRKTICFIYRVVALESNWESLKLEANHAVGRGDFKAATESWVKALESLDEVKDDLKE